jgi:isopentenyl phosphate kinase
MEKLSSMKNIVFLKLGGSLITDKSSAYTAKREIIDQLSIQIRDAMAENPSLRIIIGNGGGSYGHYAVIEHDVTDGIALKKNAIGFSYVQKAVTELNRIIVDSLVNKGVAAVSFHPSSAVTGNDGKIDSFCVDSLAEMVKVGLTPVMYGDIIVDSKRGSMIASTEMLITAAIEPLKRHGLQTNRVIHNGIVKGVLDKNGNVISQVSHRNFSRVKKSITKTEGYDVTGGMLHKLEESLKLAENKVQTLIINGVSARNLLKNALLDKKIIGTVIR